MVAIKRTSTHGECFLNVLVYGAPGSGKTTMISTANAPLVLSAEGGLLSLQGFDIPYVEIATLADLQDAHAFLESSAEARGFDWVCLDSISEIAETILLAEKKATKDGRKAYGEMADTMRRVIRAFRDLKKHVYMSAKSELVRDDASVMARMPSLPGSKITNDIPFFFDEVLALREMPAEGEASTVRWLQTSSFDGYVAKDRSGKLNQFEEPNLEALREKILGKK